MIAARDAVGTLHEFVSRSLDDVLLGADDVAAAQANALSLFQSVAASVPAYGEFLRSHGIDSSNIVSFEDFQSLPLVTKTNYLQRFPLAQLAKPGCDFVAVSSGSTGKPTFWPRSMADELPIARRFEQVFRDSFHAHERSTLAVVCFALGTWVGGMYTTQSSRLLAARGYPITVISPGNNKPEILRVVSDLGSGFDQVVLLGYPPFLKDVIDTGIASGINWSALHIRLVMAGEVFSEEWRTLVGQRMGSTRPLVDSASLYGTADAGVLGNETPLSVAIRRFLGEHPDAARDLFGESRLPTLVQYDPRARFFEQVDGTLLFSGDNGVPLIRYHIADSGGLLTFDQMLAFCRANGFDALAAVGDATVRRMPFVYVFGRADFTISYFGANVFPENVTVGLEQSPVDAWVTGKFVMQAREDAALDQYLSVIVELAPGVSDTTDKAGAIADSVLANLLRLNSEYANYVPAARQRPRVELRAMGDPDYFPIGVKHRYSRR